jgi:hypothetical protein
MLGTARGLTTGSQGYYDSGLAPGTVRLPADLRVVATPGIAN